MVSDDPEDDDPLQKWHDAEKHLSSEPTGVEERLSSEPTDPGRAAEESAPQAPEIEDVDVSSETSRHFWAAVGLANLGIAGVSLGLMLIGFRGQWVEGGVLVLVGLFALARTYHVYRRFRSRRADEAASESDGDADGSSDAEP